MAKAHFLIFDFETLSHIPWEAPVVSWGAIAGRWTDEVKTLRQNGFYRVIEPIGQEKYGRKPSKQTIQWWKEKSEEAQAVLYEKNKVSMTQALMDFNKYVNDNFINKDTQIWIRAPQYDFVLMESLYQSYGMQCPLEPWKVRDTRTACDLLYKSKNGYAPNAKAVFDREGIIEHHALDDCIKEFLQIRPYFLNND